MCLSVLGPQCLASLLGAPLGCRALCGTSEVYVQCAAPHLEIATGHHCFFLPSVRTLIPGSVGRIHVHRIYLYVRTRSLAGLRRYHSKSFVDIHSSLCAGGLSVGWLLFLPAGSSCLPFCRSSTLMSPFFIVQESCSCVGAYVLSVSFLSLCVSCLLFFHVFLLRPCS